MEAFNDDACFRGAVYCNPQHTLVQECGKLSCMAHFEVLYGSRDQLLACRGARATSEAEKMPRSQETALRRCEMLWKGLEGGHLPDLVFVFGEEAVFS